MPPCYISNELNRMDSWLTLPQQICKGGTLWLCYGTGAWDNFSYPPKLVFVQYQVTSGCYFHNFYMNSNFNTFCLFVFRVNGWMTDYHVRHNFTNPAHVNHFLPQARE